MRGIRTLIALVLVSIVSAGAATAGMSGVAASPRGGAKAAAMDVSIVCWTAEVVLRIGQTTHTFQAEVVSSAHGYCTFAETVCPTWGCAPLAERITLLNHSVGFEAEGAVVWGACRATVCAQADPQVCCGPPVTLQAFEGRLGATRFVVATDPCDTPFFVCTTKTL